MTSYIKLILIASLALLLSHCGKSEKMETKEVALSPALKRADCISGVYTATAEVDDSFLANFQANAKIQLSIAHNANNEDAKIILFAEELQEPNNESQEATQSPSAVCTVLSNIQYNKNVTSTLSSENTQSSGALKSVVSIKNNIQFIELHEDDAQEFKCQPQRAGFVFFSNQEGEELNLPIFSLKKPDLVTSYEDLEKRCMALKQNNSSDNTEKENQAETGDNEDATNTKVVATNTNADQKTGSW